MRNAFRKIGVGSYLSVFAFIMCIVAISLYGANISNAYFSDSVSGTVVSCTIVAMIALAAYVALDFFADRSIIIRYVCDILPAVAAFCLFTAFAVFLHSRVYSMAIIYGSNLEDNNPSARPAMSQAIVCLVFYLIAAIATIVAAFFDPFRREKKSKAADDDTVEAAA